MINHELRSQGIGASEVAAILGMDPRRDAFAVWARKLKLVDEPESNVRMRKGKYFERGIIDWYGDETGNLTEWSDTTVQHPSRTFQICTPDAYVLSPEGTSINGKVVRERIGGCDAKLVSWDQRDGWGDPGTDVVPDHYAIQNQWTCSTLNQPWWDIAAALGDELRTYRIHRNPKTEEVLLDVVERFWRVNILGRTQPEIGATDTAKEYLKKQFPKDIEPLRSATEDEVRLMQEYRTLHTELKALEPLHEAAGNALRLAIGKAAGILHGDWKVSLTKDKDSIGTDWKAVAIGMTMDRCECGGCGTALQELVTCKKCGGTGEVRNPVAEGRLRALEANSQIVTRVGPRKLRATFGKKAKA